MIVKLRWFMTGNVTEMDEADDLLNPSTTVLELKGLIQVRFGFPPKELAIIHKHLLDNHTTLRDVGITSSSSDVVLTAHVVRSSAGLEKRNVIDGNVADEDDDAHDDGLQEFSHDDFILAMRMLGKDVPVSGERLQQVREQAPRSRPAFLNTNSSASSAAIAEGAPAAASGEYHPRNTEVHKIFRDFRYSLRKEGAEKEFQVEYPGAEPFQYWDMRLPEDEKHQSLCSLNEVAFELFFFGEFTLIGDHQKFLALVRRVLEVKAGVLAKTPLPIREAGCMYPLVAVPVVMTEMEGMNLGALLFDEFGTAVPSSRAQQDGEAVAGKPSGGCGQQ